MTFKTAQEVVVEVNDLFSLPDIYFQLNDMIQDSQRSLTDIGNVIAKDPALSARLLRIVNSAFYGFPAKIETMSRAILVVGIDDLYNLVVATCVVDRFSKISTDLVDMTSFWLRSVHCGVLNRLLAKAAGEPNVERLFLVGLLHDIGSLVMYQLMPEQAARVLLTIQHDRRLLAPVEQQLLGFTHAAVGGELMKTWGMPESLYETVACYRDPGSAVAYEFDAKLLHLASRLVDDKEFGRPVEQTLAEVADEDLTYLRLTRQQVAEVMEQSELDFHDVFEQFLPE